MKTRSILSVAVAIVSISNATLAVDLYSENFDSGNASRSVWTELSLDPPGTFDASSGHYVITGQDEATQDTAMVGVVSGVPEVANLTNTSVRTRMSVEGTSSGIALIARVDLNDNTWYQGGYNPDDQQLYLGWNNPQYNEFTPDQAADFEFNFGAEDLMLQFDVVGDELSLWAWKASEEMPDQPQLQFTDNIVQFASGSPGLLFDASSIDSPSSATFRFIQVADMHIPDLLPGDFNGNGAVEQADLDLVLLNWGAETPPIPDGWTGDPPNGLIEQNELDDVLLNWGSDIPGDDNAVAVPEPATWLLLLVAIASACSRRRRSGS